MKVLKETLTRNNKWGKYSPFSKIMIIRGIGYRAFYLINDLESNAYTEFKYSKYLVIRAGHTSDYYQGVFHHTNIKIIKKERKLVVYCPFNAVVSSIAKNIVNYRSPSVYTGRGIRLKGSKPLRKAGKKDKQKGKSY